MKILMQASMSICPRPQARGYGGLRSSVHYVGFSGEVA